MKDVARKHETYCGRSKASSPEHHGKCLTCESFAVLGVLVAKDKPNHPVADWRAGVEQPYQVKRMIGGIGNIFVTVQCSECQSGETFEQTRVIGGSIYDSLKVTNSECQSNGNLKQAWVSGGRGHDSLNIVTAL